MLTIDAGLFFVVDQLGCSSIPTACITIMHDQICRASCKPHSSSDTWLAFATVSYSCSTQLVSELHSFLFVTYTARLSASSNLVGIFSMLYKLASQNRTSQLRDWRILRRSVHSNNLYCYFSFRIIYILAFCPSKSKMVEWAEMKVVFLSICICLFSFCRMFLTLVYHLFLVCSLNPPSFTGDLCPGQTRAICARVKPGHSASCVRMNRAVRLFLY